MNLLYLFYFILKAEYPYIKTELKNMQNVNKVKLWLDVIGCTLKYGSSLEDYFIFRFYEKSHEERSTYVTKGLAHEFFKQMNNKQYIKPFKDKKLFDELFANYINRKTLISEDLNEDEFNDWCTDKNNLFIKPIEGTQGKGIYKVNVQDKTKLKSIYNEIKNKNYIIEEAIEQHEEMNKLNSDSVNTLRIITVNINNNPRIIAAILRVGTGAIVDNFTEGGIAAPVNIENGKIFRDAIAKEHSVIHEYHPVSKVKIKGFQIPFWEDVRNMVLSASQEIPEVKTVGWDVAISKNGPELVEGNDNWNKNIFQLAYNQGRKEEIEAILKEDNSEKSQA